MANSGNLQVSNSGEPLDRWFVIYDVAAGINLLSDSQTFTQQGKPAFAVQIKSSGTFTAKVTTRGGDTIADVPFFASDAQWAPIRQMWVTGTTIPGGTVIIGMY